MRILAVADVEARAYYDWYTPGKLDEFDLILSCGDLPKEYLEFLVTMARCPLVYVHGNHDERYDSCPPEGCVCAEDRIITVQGVRLLGLGGSHRYREGTHQYTEREMARRIQRLGFSLRRHGGFDLLLTHAPMRGVHDMDTQVHRGFECFGGLIDRWQPKALVHGHIHKSYGVNIPQRSEYHGTAVYNAFDHCVIEL